jgi:hypothetical protein
VGTQSLSRLRLHLSFAEKGLSDIRKVVVAFHYAEKIKSNLIIATNLLGALSGMNDSEIVGAEKLLTVYFDSLTTEVNIAANASGVQKFEDVRRKLEEAVRLLKEHNYSEPVKSVAEAMSITTTAANEAAETLSKKGLI